MILNNFLKFILNNTHTFRGLLPNHIFRVHANITDTFEEFTHFSRYKLYWHLQSVTRNPYYKPLQISHHYQILKFSKQAILHTFSEFT